MAGIVTAELVRSPAAPPVFPAALFAPTPKAAKRVLEFFTAQINNDHTRKAYLNATRRFAAWCDARGIRRLADVHPFHVAAFVKELLMNAVHRTIQDAAAASALLVDAQNDRVAAFYQRYGFRRGSSLTSRRRKVPPRNGASRTA